MDAKHNIYNTKIKDQTVVAGLALPSDLELTISSIESEKPNATSTALCKTTRSDEVNKYIADSVMTDDFESRVSEILKQSEIFYHAHKANKEDSFHTVQENGTSFSTSDMFPNSSLLRQSTLTEFSDEMDKSLENKVTSIPSAFLIERDCRSFDGSGRNIDVWGDLSSQQDPNPFFVPEQQTSLPAPKSRYGAKDIDINDYQARDYPNLSSNGDENLGYSRDLQQERLSYMPFTQKATTPSGTKSYNGNEDNAINNHQGRGSTNLSSNGDDNFEFSRGLQQEEFSYIAQKALEEQSLMNLMSLRQKNALEKGGILEQLSNSIAKITLSEASYQSNSSPSGSIDGELTTTKQSPNSQLYSVTNNRFQNHTNHSIIPKEDTSDIIINTQVKNVKTFNYQQNSQKLLNKHSKQESLSFIDAKVKGTNNSKYFEENSHDLLQNSDEESISLMNSGGINKNLSLSNQQVSHDPFHKHSKQESVSYTNSVNDIPVSHQRNDQDISQEPSNQEIISFMGSEIKDISSTYQQNSQDLFHKQSKQENPSIINSETKDIPISYHQNGPDLSEKPSNQEIISFMGSEIKDISSTYRQNSQDLFHKQSKQENLSFINSETKDIPISYHQNGPDLSQKPSNQESISLMGSDEDFQPLSHSMMSDAEKSALGRNVFEAADAGQACDLSQLSTKTTGSVMEDGGSFGPILGQVQGQHPDSEVDAKEEYFRSKSCKVDSFSDIKLDSFMGFKRDLLESPPKPIIQQESFNSSRASFISCSDFSYESAGESDACGRTTSSDDDTLMLSKTNSFKNSSSNTLDRTFVSFSITSLPENPPSWSQTPSYNPTLDNNFDSPSYITHMSQNLRTENSNNSDNTGNTDNTGKFAKEGPLETPSNMETVEYPNVDDDISPNEISNTGKNFLKMLKEFTKAAMNSEDPMTFMQKNFIDHLDHINTTADSRIDDGSNPTLSTSGHDTIDSTTDHSSTMDKIDDLRNLRKNLQRGFMESSKLSKNIEKSLLHNDKQKQESTNPNGYIDNINKTNASSKDDNFFHHTMIPDQNNEVDFYEYNNTNKHISSNSVINSDLEAQIFRNLQKQEEVKVASNSRKYSTPLAEVDSPQSVSDFFAELKLSATVRHQESHKTLSPPFSVSPEVLKLALRSIQVDIVTDTGIIDFGEVPEECCFGKEVSIVNNSSEVLPVLVHLEQAHEEGCFTFIDGSSTAPFMILAQDLAALTLPSLSTTTIGIRCKVPKYTTPQSGPDGGFLEVRGDFRLLLDTPLDEEVLLNRTPISCNVFEVKLGLVGTKIPTVIQYSPGLATKSTVCIRNRSLCPITVKAQIASNDSGTSLSENVALVSAPFRVLSDHVVMATGAKEKIDLMFTPDGRNENAESCLVLCVVPEGITMYIPLVAQAVTALDNGEPLNESNKYSEDNYLNKKNPQNFKSTHNNPPNDVSTHNNIQNSINFNNDLKNFSSTKTEFANLHQDIIRNNVMNNTSSSGHVNSTKNSTSLGNDIVDMSNLKQKDNLVNLINNSSNDAMCDVPQNGHSRGLASQNGNSRELASQNSSGNSDYNTSFGTSRNAANQNNNSQSKYGPKEDIKCHNSQINDKNINGNQRQNTNQTENQRPFSSQGQNQAKFSSQKNISSTREENVKSIPHHKENEAPNLSTKFMNKENVDPLQKLYADHKSTENPSFNKKQEPPCNVLSANSKSLFFGPTDIGSRSYIKLVLKNNLADSHLPLALAIESNGPFYFCEHPTMGSPQDLTDPSSQKSYSSTSGNNNESKISKNTKHELRKMNNCTESGKGIKNKYPVSKKHDILRNTKSNPGNVANNSEDHTNSTNFMDSLCQTQFNDHNQTVSNRYKQIILEPGSRITLFVAFQPNDVAMYSNQIICKPRVKNMKPFKIIFKLNGIGGSGNVILKDNLDQSSDALSLSFGTPNMGSPSLVQGHLVNNGNRTLCAILRVVEQMGTNRTLPFNEVCIQPSSLILEPYQSKELYILTSGSVIREHYRKIMENQNGIFAYLQIVTVNEILRQRVKRLVNFPAKWKKQAPLHISDLDFTKSILNDDESNNWLEDPLSNHLSTGNGEDTAFCQDCKILEIPLNFDLNEDLLNDNMDNDPTLYVVDDCHETLTSFLNFSTMNNPEKLEKTLSPNDLEQDMSLNVQSKEFEVFPQKLFLNFSDQKPKNISALNYTQKEQILEVACDDFWLSVEPKEILVAPGKSTVFAVSLLRQNISKRHPPQKSQTEIRILSQNSQRVVSVHLDTDSRVPIRQPGPEGNLAASSGFFPPSRGINAQAPPEDALKTNQSHGSKDRKLTGGVYFQAQVRFPDTRVKAQSLVKIPLQNYHDDEQEVELSSDWTNFVATQRKFKIKPHHTLQLPVFFQPKRKGLLRDTISVTSRPATIPQEKSTITLTGQGL